MKTSFFLKCMVQCNACILIFHFHNQKLTFKIEGNQRYEMFFLFLFVFFFFKLFIFSFGMCLRAIKFLTRFFLMKTVCFWQFPDPEYDTQLWGLGQWGEAYDFWALCQWEGHEPRIFLPHLQGAVKQQQQYCSGKSCALFHFPPLC